MKRFQNLLYDSYVCICHFLNGRVFPICQSKDTFEEEGGKNILYNTKIKRNLKSWTFRLFGTHTAVTAPPTTHYHPITNPLSPTPTPTPTNVSSLPSSYFQENFFFSILTPFFFPSVVAAVFKRRLSTLFSNPDIAAVTACLPVGIRMA